MEKNEKELNKMKEEEKKTGKEKKLLSEEELDQIAGGSGLLIPHK